MATTASDPGYLPSRRSGRILAAPFEPLVAAATHPVEMIAAHLHAVAIEVDPDLVPGAAPRAPR